MVNMEDREIAIAVLGSSGGGSAALGQSDAIDLLGCVKDELEQAGLQLGAVQFVFCSSPLDNVKESAKLGSVLYALDCEGALQTLEKGSLQDVNIAARNLDVSIAKDIAAGRIEGVLLISSDPLDVNNSAIKAAVSANCCICGTGGTSIGTVAAMGGNMQGSSGGSVATTNKSKAVTLVAGLAKYYGLAYSPYGRLRCRANVTSVLAGCLPIFLTATVVMSIANLMAGESGESDTSWVIPFATNVTWSGVAQSVVNCLPIVVAAVGAQQSSTLKDMAVLAGIMAGVVSNTGSEGGQIATALISGVAAGELTSLFTVGFLSLGLPATALTLYATGLAGLTAGVGGQIVGPYVEMVSDYALPSLTMQAGEASRNRRGLEGAVMGIFMSYGSKIGMYHWIFLPLVIMEMGRGQPAVIGALDFTCLCMVGLGICLAMWVCPTEKADLPLARRGSLFNFLFGDFVEACFPFMEANRWANYGGYIGSAAAGAIIGYGGLKSTAYLPAPLAILISNDMKLLALAAGVSFAIPFVMTIIGNLCWTWREGKGEALKEKLAKQMADEDDDEDDAHEDGAADDNGGGGGGGNRKASTDSSKGSADGDGAKKRKKKKKTKKKK